MTLKFGNDLSRIVRGIAIIMMVVNHSLPGRITGVAVLLFTFLVGYGYAFAREHSIRHSLGRVWHLLRGYWFVLLGVCLPAALLGWNGHLHADEVAKGLFGLDPTLNFYSWYVWLYICLMAVLPWCAGAIDRYGLRALVPLVAVCVAGRFGAQLWDAYAARYLLKLATWLPVALVAYYVAHGRLIERISVPRHPLTAVVAVAAMVGVYFLRTIPAAQWADALLAPVIAVAVAAIFGLYALTPLRAVLTELGLKSMNIWFLHALFFTYSTRDTFGLVVGWIAWKPLWIAAVILLSYLMSIAVDYISDGLKKSILARKTLFIWSD